MGERKKAIGRLIAVLYLATLGAFVVIPIATLLAGIFWLIDWLKSLILGSPLMRGNRILLAPFVYHWELTTFVVWGDSFPGYNPWASEFAPSSSAA